jgi:hypothetical protein
MRARPLPGGRESVGWLVDIQAEDEYDLKTLLRDMRLLGLEPAVLRGGIARCSADGRLGRTARPGAICEK